MAESSSLSQLHTPCPGHPLPPKMGLNAKYRAETSYRIEAGGPYRSTAYGLFDVAIYDLTTGVYARDCFRRTVHGPSIDACHVECCGGLLGPAPPNDSAMVHHEQPRPTTCNRTTGGSPQGAAIVMEARVTDTWICPSASCVLYLLAGLDDCFMGRLYVPKAPKKRSDFLSRSKIIARTVFGPLRASKKFVPVASRRISSVCCPSISL